MSDNGGSDLDVFKTLSKAPPSAHKQTLVGLAVPPPPPSAPSAVPPSRLSGLPPPPPPPSVRASSPSHPGMAAPTATAAASMLRGAEAEEVQEIDEVDELPSNVEHEAPDQNFGEGDATEVFHLGETGAARDSEPYQDRPSVPMPLAALQGGSTVGLSSAVGLPAPPPPPSALGSSLGLPLPPPPSAVSLPPPPPPSTTSSLPPPSRTSSLPRPPAPSYASLSRPPAPPPPSVTSGGEWDDEDDKTTIYTRDSHMPQFLLGATPPRTAVPDAPPPPMSRPTAPIPVMSATPTMQPQRVSPMVDAPASVPPGPAANRTPLLLGGLALGLLGIVLFFLLRPSTGGLVVTVAGPGNKPLDVVEVLIDGKVTCKSSPCIQKDLPAGTHMVQARADGYQETAETAVLVTGKQDAVHNIRLVQAGGSGVRISAHGSGLRLVVDGREVGPLPQELNDMSPGPHVLRVEGEQFDTWEQTVTVMPDQMQAIGPLKLRVKNGLAKIVAGRNADGAKVILETDGDRRALNSLPITLHIDTAKPSTLIATRKGYDTYRQSLTFEDGSAERTFEVELFAEESGDSPRSAPRGGSVGAAAPPRAPAAAGTATLNINSIPAASVILDGRPIGTTPKVGVSVSAGSHTVVFVKDGERQAKSVTVAAGQTQTVAHRFK